MSWLDEMEAADPAYPGDVSYPAARTRAGRGLYQLHDGLDDGHLNAARDLIADWYARQANDVNEARPGDSDRDWRPVRDAEANARQIGLRASMPQPHEHESLEYQAAPRRRTGDLRPRQARLHLGEILHRKRLLNRSRMLTMRGLAHGAPLRARRISDLQLPGREVDDFGRHPIQRIRQKLADIAHCGELDAD